MFQDNLQCAISLHETVKFLYCSV